MAKMKCTIPEISWHNRDPVLSVDIQPTIIGNETYRLASGGTDSHVLIWHLNINENGSVNLDLAADLTRHQRAVNVVKWSPNGEYLASGDDESYIIIWKQKGENEHLNIVDTTNEQDKEIWITMKNLRGHMEDIYDLSWSPNSQFLVSGSVDNTAMIWDVQKGKSLCILNDHKGFVQGVAWDPLNQYIATLSTDRYLRIFDIKTKKVISRNSKCTLPVPEGQELHGKTIRIYHDDTLQTFFRRLCFSPDGKLLIAPAGVTDYDGCTKPLNTTYIYSRYSLKQPAIVLPSPDQYTVAVKCCPILFKLRPHTDTNQPVIPLPYRIIFAVATKSSVYLYDTQQRMPFGLISNIHYTRLTDLTWSKDAKILVVSSTDGFCSLITFSDNELGEIYNETNKENKEKENCKSNSKDNLKTKKNEINRNGNQQNSEDVIMIEDDDNQEKEVKNLIKNQINEKESLKQEIPSTSETVKVNSPSKLTNSAISTVNSGTKLILDKDIISSVDKFETPEKKNQPATPISIRRHPRTSTTPNLTSPSSSTPSKSTNQINFQLKIENDIQKTPSQKFSSEKNDQKQKQQTKSSKKCATPIQVRRQPRILIPNPVEATAIVEEANDSWPNNSCILVKIHDNKETLNNEEKNCLKIEENQQKKDEFKSDNEKDNQETKKIEEKIMNNSKQEILTSEIELTTEDIRLVYEDTQDEDDQAKQN